MDPHRKGRLGAPDASMLEFTASHEADSWLAPFDLDVSRAHVLALAKAGHVPAGDASALLSALDLVEAMLPLPQEDHEDVHMAVESAVADTVGAQVAGRLHTGRSRNDQVATGIRMAARREMLRLAAELSTLVEALLSRAGDYADSVMPGYTHLQRAQPVTLGFHLSAHATALVRDLRRLLAAFDTTNLCPLGSAAFSGTGFTLDRAYEAELLGFAAPLGNNMDAVSTRDFAVQALGDVVNLQLDLGRLAGELALWTTPEFGFVRLPDAWASTSSVMPQKKNPDVLELVRARGGTALGHFTAAASILRGLPYSYNRDLQQVTPHLHDALCDAQKCCRVMARAVEGASFDVDEMARRAGDGFACATELADALVRRTGIPFRQAHHVVGRLARDGAGCAAPPTLDNLDRICRDVTGEDASRRGFTAADLHEALDPRRAVASRTNLGGTARVAVEEGIASLTAELVDVKAELRRREGALDTGREALLHRCRDTIKKREASGGGGRSAAQREEKNG